MPSVVRMFLGQLAAARRDTTARRALSLTIRSRFSRGSNVFQPYNDTLFDRYPQIFSHLRTDAAVEVLSFGCSTGEELFSLRKYLPNANITGLDANGANVFDCRRKIEEAADTRMRVRLADSVQDEPTGRYDLIFAMAVFRHGALSYADADSCASFIRFASFEASIAELVRCLKTGGKLVVENSNFRVADTAAAAGLECELHVPRPAYNPQAPLYDRNNQLLNVPSYPDVIFRKISQ